MNYNLGRVLPIFRGTYDSTAQYTNLDVVYFNGSSYVATGDTVGNAPTDTEHWVPVALAGTLSPEQVEAIQEEVIAYVQAQGYVIDANYVHTDNNFTNADKSKLNSIDMSTKQDTLVSGQNIATINGNNLLEGGNIVIQGGGGGTSDYTQLSNLPSINGTTLTGNVNLATPEQLAAKQDTLVSGTNIKTVNSQSLIGSGNITIESEPAVNPFKGWFDNLTSLQTITPVVGDYGYVKGATTADPVKIYECTTAGTWSDSGRTVDTSNVQSFASGQAVNDVKIKDETGEEVQGTADVLSAEAGVELNMQINGGSVIEGTVDGTEVWTDNNAIVNYSTADNWYYWDVNSQPTPRNSKIIDLNEYKQAGYNKIEIQANQEKNTTYSLFNDSFTPNAQSDIIPSVLLTMLSGQMGGVGFKSLTVNNSLIIDIDTDVRYIVFRNEFTGTSGTFNYAPSVVSIVKQVEIPGINDNIGSLNTEVQEIQEQLVGIGNGSLYGGVVYPKATAASLTDGEIMYVSDYPRGSKSRGETIVFRGNVTTFGKLSIGKSSISGAFGSDYSSWLEIDDTNVVIKKNTNVTAKTIPHGLTIQNTINVIISTNDDGQTKIIIGTVGSNSTAIQKTITVGLYDGDGGYTAWQSNNYGSIRALSTGSALTNCELSVSNKHLRNPFWVFGASYETTDDTTSWPYYSKSNGFYEFYINALPGRNSASTYTDLQRALTLGTPKFLLWTMWGNDSAADLDTYIGNVKSLCDEKGITLIIVDRPNSPASSSQYTTRKQVIDSYIDAGVRYWNIAAAVSSNPSDANSWYEGYLQNDGQHPTALGSRAMAMQLLVDVPELAQF